MVQSDVRSFLRLFVDWCFCSLVCFCLFVSLFVCLFVCFCLFVSVPLSYVAVEVHGSSVLNANEDCRPACLHSWADRSPHQTLVGCTMDEVGHRIRVKYILIVISTTSLLVDHLFGGNFVLQVWELSSCRA